MQGVDAVLIQRITLTMPLDAVLLEEIAFRGVLMGALSRLMPLVGSVLTSAAVFSAWHIVINYRTLGLTNLADEPVFIWLGLAGAHVAVFGGGLLFALLRARYGSLIPCAAAHWALNAGVLLGLALAPRIL